MKTSLSSPAAPPPPWPFYVIDITLMLPGPAQLIRATSHSRSVGRFWHNTINFVTNGIEGGGKRDWITVSKRGQKKPQKGRKLHCRSPLEHTVQTLADGVSHLFYSMDRRAVPVPVTRLVMPTKPPSHKIFAYIPSGKETHEVFHPQKSSCATKLWGNERIARDCGEEASLCQYCLR